MSGQVNVYVCCLFMFGIYSFQMATLGYTFPVLNVVAKSKLGVDPSCSRLQACWDVKNIKLTRSDFVKSFTAITPLVFLTKGSEAAVPSIAEYEIGSGTVIKKEEQFRIPTFTKPTDKGSALKALDETQNMLSSFQVVDS